MPQQNSIRRTLLARLMAPLLALVLVAGASAYGLAQHFSQHVLDQWLYDSAISLAKQVRSVNGRAAIDLPGSAVEILEWDAADSIYYEVVSAARGRIFGNAYLPPPPSQPIGSTDPVYYDGGINGMSVRALAISLTLPQGDTVLVKVAETRHKRDTLATHVLWATLVLSMLLVAVSAALIWYGIGSGMTSLERAVREIRVRDAAAPLTPLPTESGVPQEVRPLVDELNALIDELSAAHRSQQRFVVDAAHQLRTPLASLRVQLELARRERDPERHAHAVDNAVEVLSRASHLLHQLLTLAKVGENRAESLALVPTDLDRLARDEVERHLDEALECGVDLGYAAPGRPVPVLAQETLLREALANLIDNALRYAASGRYVTVGVVADPPGFYVEDRGPGIPADERERVRERFYRMPDAPGEGCGLGLPIVDEIARRHGAALSVRPGADGVGTRVGLAFPARHAGRAAALA